MRERAGKIPGPSLLFKLGVVKSVVKQKETARETASQAVLCWSEWRDSNLFFSNFAENIAFSENASAPTIA